MSACKIVADDFGMSVEINQAISELVTKNLLSKVGVMANRDMEFSIDDTWENVEVGLHFNLTLNSNMSPLKLLYMSCTNQLNINQILDGIARQHEVLINRGLKISYLDSHQHIHIIPKALKAMIIFAKKKGIHSIRCITIEKRYLLFYFYSLMRFGFFMQATKMMFLYFMGSFMKRQLDNARINYSKNLILMPLAIGGNYEGLLKTFIGKFKDEDAEIVSHPGLEMNKQIDSYTKGRFVEYRSVLNWGKF